MNSNFHRYITSILLICGLLFVIPVFGQQPVPLKLLQLKGKYTSPSFYARIVDEQDQHFEHNFYADNFVGNLGTVKYSCRNTTANRDVWTYEGIIDTTGKIIIPCIYEDATIFFEPGKGQVLITEIFSVQLNGSRFLVDRNNRVIHEMHPSTEEADKNKSRGSDHYIGTYDDITNELAYIAIRKASKYGLFSVAQKKVIVEPEFENIQVHNQVAVCTIGDLAVAIDGKTGQRSTYFKKIIARKNGVFAVQDRYNNWFVYTDFFNGNEGIKSSVQLLENYSGYQIIKSEKGIGVCDENDKLTVPLQYDDIYFLNNELLLLKKKGFWAISTYDHKLLTAFEFIDVELQNKMNFTNFLHYSQIDTTGLVISRRIAQLNDERDNFLATAEDLYELNMLNETIRLSKEINRRIISPYIFLTLKKTDGYHMIKFPGGETAIEIDPLSWDNVFVIPVAYSSASVELLLGVQKGNKFGYYSADLPVKKYLVYDNIRFNVGSFYSTTSNDSRYTIVVSPYLVVKRGTAYYKKTKWIPFSNLHEVQTMKKWGKDVRKI